MNRTIERLTLEQMYGQIQHASEQLPGCMDRSLGLLFLEVSLLFLKKAEAQGRTGIPARDRLFADLNELGPLLSPKQPYQAVPEPIDQEPVNLSQAIPEPPRAITPPPPPSPPVSPPASPNQGDMMAMMMEMFKAFTQSQNVSNQAPTPTPVVDRNLSREEMREIQRRVVKEAEREKEERIKHPPPYRRFNGVSHVCEVCQRRDVEHEFDENYLSPKSKLPYLKKMCDGTYLYDGTTYVKQGIPASQLPT